MYAPPVFYRIIAVWPNMPYHSNGLAQFIRHGPRRIDFALSRPPQSRWQSSSASIGLSSSKEAQPIKNIQTTDKTALPMARVATSSLLRTMAMSFFLTRPALMKPGMAIMRRVAESQSLLLNPDRNPLLRMFIKPLIYNQFCAGTNRSEIQETVSGIKALGFSGVILCYGKEIQLDRNNGVLGKQGKREAGIMQWRDGNVETLDMLHPGNWLGIKYTGAGQDVTEAPLAWRRSPATVLECVT